jgi:DNA-directed RNA polymerase subunit RPC12/RpoP
MAHGNHKINVGETGTMYCSMGQVYCGKCGTDLKDVLNRTRVQLHSCNKETTGKDLFLIIPGTTEPHCPGCGEKIIAWEEVCYA